MMLFYGMMEITKFTMKIKYAEMQEIKCSLHTDRYCSALRETQALLIKEMACLIHRLGTLPILQTRLPYLQIRLPNLWIRQAFKTSLQVRQCQCLI